MGIFKVRWIWSVLSVNSTLKIDSVTKDIRLPVSQIRDLLLFYVNMQSRRIKGGIEPFKIILLPSFMVDRGLLFPLNWAVPQNGSHMILKTVDMSID
jgi:hypothetical protein